MPQTYNKSNIARFNHVIDVGKPRSVNNEVLNWPQDLTIYVKGQKTKNNRKFNQIIKIKKTEKKTKTENRSKKIKQI